MTLSELLPEILGGLYVQLIAVGVVVFGIWFLLSFFKPGAWIKFFAACLSFAITVILVGAVQRQLIADVSEIDPRLVDAGIAFVGLTGGFLLYGFVAGRALRHFEHDRYRLGDLIGSVACFASAIGLWILLAEIGDQLKRSLNALPAEAWIPWDLLILFLPPTMALFYFSVVRHLLRQHRSLSPFESYRRRAESVEVCE